MFCFFRSLSSFNILNQRKLFNELSLFLDRFNGILSSWLAAVYIVGIASGICRAAMAVAKLQIPSLVVSLTASLLLLYISNRCARVNEESRKLRRMRQGEARDLPWLKSSWKACRSLRVYIGPFMYADSKMGLKVLSVILTNTASLLMEARLE